MIDGSQQVWNGPNFQKYGNVSWYTDTTAIHYRNTAKEWFNEYMIGVGGLCSVYDPPVSYWCSEHPSGGGAFPFRTPSGVIYKPPNGPYEHGEDARFFVWRPARWANWMFDVASYDKATNNFTFGRGGNQGARGSNQGGDFFIENVMEELDYPGEFFFDTRAQKLYLYHNGTGAPSDSIVVPQVQVLVNLTGTQWKPVKGVQLKNLAFSAAAPTYMMPHGVPSAGDWALDRYSAVFLQGTQKTLIDGCTFERLEGNAVMISGYNRDATVESSDFAFLGGNAIVAWGYTNETSTDPGRPGIILNNAPKAGIDGTDGEHPVRTTVQNCSAREIGLYEKQSSFFVQAKTAESRILSNVFFNGPRAGINMNDGFGGGDEIAYNLVFSTCRESGDHGPFNSWDRQPFLTTVRTGEPSMIMQWRRIHHNFFIDNYSPQEGVDNDDGSSYYKTHDNFLVYGNQAMKNDFGGHDNHHFDNVDAYIGHALTVVETLEGHEDYFYGNYVVLQWETVGSCLPQKQMHDNHYFTPTGKVKEGCEGFGGNVSKLPRDEEILNQAKKKLGMLQMDIALVGIIFFLLIYGVLQERIMTEPYDQEVFDSSLFLVLCNRLLAVVCSLTAILCRGESLQNAAPKWQYALVSMSNVGATACQYEALKYVSFAVQMLGKSFKMLPVMIWSMNISGAQYGYMDWSCAAVVTLGVAQFVLVGPTESHRSETATTGLGYLFILGFLIFDGATSALQEKLFKEHRTSRCNQMFYVNLFSSLLSSVLLLLTGTAGSATNFFF
eukprot:symbB.v1.2.014992.t1/scaffold1092.1/size138572/3